MNKVKLGVLISGSGSNLQSIIDNIEAGSLSAEIKVVVSNATDAYGLTRAEKHGLKTEMVEHKNFPSREDFDARLVQVLKENDVELVVLAGFMRVITSTFLKAFPNQIMNIHPALLPSFPGVHVWQTAIDYGVKFSGCTVHFVDEGTDTGPIIIQSVVPVLDDDDADTLAARILKQEHKIYPRAIQLYAEGRLEIQGRLVKVLPLDKSLDTASLTNPGLD
ncbi:MAG: phosphoribosylglycinamide formyltransferase [Deltaproteobacteria bacterium]|nr:phosphoribosylglycinamide formyltransferase [Deltaproteobacteria bacterium]MBW2142738.1 phosphoribosylglycinamide formyltransferase [Deltaproteobacteria bacterium]